MVLPAALCQESILILFVLERLRKFAGVQAIGAGVRNQLGYSLVELLRVIVQLLFTRQRRRLEDPLTLVGVILKIRFVVHVDVQVVELVIISAFSAHLV